MGHVGSAHAEGDGAKSAVCRRVRIGTGNQQPRLGDALLRRHDVQNALPRIIKTEQLDAVQFGVFVLRDHHVADFIDGDTRDTLLAAGGGHVMIRKGQDLMRARH